MDRHFLILLCCTVLTSVRTGFLLLFTWVLCLESTPLQGLGKVSATPHACSRVAFFLFLKVSYSPG